MTNWEWSSNFGPTCSVDTDCDASPWGECKNGVCSHMSKSCVNHCSDNGKCTYVSIVDSNITFDDCSITNFNCVSKCLCYDGYASSDCSITESEWLEMQLVRSRVVEAIRQVSLIEDTTRENVKSWLDALSAIAFDAANLNNSTKQSVATLVIEYMTKAKELGISFEEMKSVSSILEVILPSGVDANGKPLANTLIDVYADYILSDMIVGQHPIIVLNKMFRLKTFSLDGLDNATVSAPWTPLEDVTGKHSQNAILPPSATGGQFKVAIIEEMTTDHELNASQLVSVPLAIAFDGSPCGNSSIPCLMEIVLQYGIDLPPSFNVSNPEHVYFKCRYKEKFNHSFTCSTGDVLSTYCNGSVAGVMSMRCPTYEPSAVCESIGSTSSRCSVKTYTPFNVTCECTIPTESTYGGRRRLQADDDGSSDETLHVNFVAASSQVAIEFVHTWESAGDISASDVKNTWPVLVTVSTIAFASILMMYIGWKFDRAEADNVSKDKSDGSSSTRKTLTVAKQTSSNELTLTPLGISAMSFNTSSPRKPTRSTRVRTKSLSTGDVEAKTVEAALPHVLKPLPVWKKFLNEAKVYHRYLIYLYCVLYFIHTCMCIAVSSCAWQVDRCYNSLISQLFKTSACAVLDNEHTRCTFSRSGYL